MAKCARILTVAALIALGFWGWRVLFPSPERAIRLRLTSLAETLSVARDEGALAKISNAQEVAGFFTTDVLIEVDVPGFQDNLRGRDELLERAAAVRYVLSGLKVEFLDVSVFVGADKQSATADCAGKATVPGERDIFVQELKFQFRKTDGKWLIKRVQSVKTLSRLRTAAFLQTA